MNKSDLLEHYLLEAQRANEWHVATIKQLIREVNRLRTMVGEPPLDMATDHMGREI